MDVESHKLFMDGRSGISTPSVVMMKTLAVVGWG
jgi:hypothetical protein